MVNIPKFVLVIDKKLNKINLQVNQLVLQLGQCSSQFQVNLCSRYVYRSKLLKNASIHPKLHFFNEMMTSKSPAINTAITYVLAGFSRGAIGLAPLTIDPVDQALHASR